MTAQRFILAVTPGQSSEVKKDVTIAADMLDPTDDQIFVGWGTTVATRRGNEIINALERLLDGVRDRNLLNADYQGAALVSAINIDILQISDRRTSSSVAASTVADPDIVLGMGANVTALGHTNIIDNVCEQLRRAAQEWLHKNG